MSFSEENTSPRQELESRPEEVNALFLAFKNEIRALQVEEEDHAKKKQDGTLKDGGTYNLIGINLDELVQEDMDMWEAIKHYRPTGGKVISLIFEDYRSRGFAAGNRHRMDFAGFLANKLTPIIMRENLGDFGSK